MVGRTDVAGRTRAVALTSAAVAVLALGVPSMVAARFVVVDDERSEVQRSAVTIAAGASRDPRAPGDAVELPAAEGGSEIGYYDVSGTLVAGAGPRGADQVAAGALDGDATAESSARVAFSTGMPVVAAAPVTSGRQVVGVVRVSTAAAVLWQRTAAVWAALAAVAASAVLVAMWSARRTAARVAQPLRALRDTAQAIGAGDLPRRAAPSGVDEVDEVADALHRTAARLEDQLLRERSLGAATSHQLRTPLMRLQLLLESVPAPAAPHVVEARAEVAAISQLVEELLALSRRGPARPVAPVQVRQLLDGVERRHCALAAAAGRQLHVGAEPDLPVVTASAAAIAHVLDVLVDNALQHGQGAVQVSAREVGGALVIDVSDDGAGFSIGDPHHRAPGDGAQENRGLGLGLAVSLVETQGGRLVLPSPDLPSSTVSVVLPP